MSLLIIFLYFRYFFDVDSEWGKFDIILNYFEKNNSFVSDYYEIFKGVLITLNKEANAKMVGALTSDLIILLNTTLAHLSNITNNQPTLVGRSLNHDSKVR